MTSIPDEYELALRAREGDRKAVSELVSRTRARLFALAYADLRHYEDANDALASALLQICRHIEDLRDPERVVAWMQSIVRNEAHRLRRGAAEAPLPLTETDTMADDGGHLLLRLDIERALREIPTRQAEALRQFYLEGVPIQAVAAEMGASEGAVKMWLYRGRRSLRAEMEGYEPMSEKTKTAPALSAAVLHSGLELELRQRMSAALLRAGYTARFLSPSDLGEPGSTEPGPWDILKNDNALVLVEPLAPRSVFEYILLLRASWETAEIPVAVVTETMVPWDPLRALAFHTVGVAGLASRDAPESLDHLFQWTGGSRSREAKAFDKAILFADDEARRAGQEKIGTEHLLLGLLRDVEIARFLREKLNVSPEGIAKTVHQQMERLPQYTRHLWRSLTAPADSATRLAREAAGGKPFGPESLLLGLILETEGLAGQVLREKGLSSEAFRTRIQS
jgi:RNA polymerase sigma factor (sigma-70 family)